MLNILFKYLFLSPKFLYITAKDYLRYLKNQEWKIFRGWGLHLFVGKFGAGKTSTMVYYAERLARRYPQLTILTNLSLSNFPEHTKILKLRCAKDILQSPPDTLVLIDEIGTIFNSRDFSSSKQSVPKILFQHICQCRKRRLMIYATTQRWNFLDKQLRDIAATVRTTRSHFGHPFTRICTVRTYDSVEYDLAFSNPMFPLHLLLGDVYLQTDRVRALFDTSEMVDNMLAAEYISDDEILANRGELHTDADGTSLDSPKKYARSFRKLGG